MLEGHGMVLEGGVQVGHRGMAGVAGLGEEGDVGKAEAGDENARRLEARGLTVGDEGGMDQRRDERDTKSGEQCENETGATHAGDYSNRPSSRPVSIGSVTSPKASRRLPA